MNIKRRDSFTFYQFDDPKDEYRLIMAVRNDLKMQKGKVAAQCGHAAVAAYAKALKECPRLIESWLKYGKNRNCNLHHAGK